MIAWSEIKADEIKIGSGTDGSRSATGCHIRKAIWQPYKEMERMTHEE